MPLRVISKDDKCRAGVTMVSKAPANIAILCFLAGIH
jgi:hypothetical protein